MSRLLRDPVDPARRDPHEDAVAAGVPRLVDRPEDAAAILAGSTP